MTLRPLGARLAVPLIFVMAVLGGTIVGARTAAADWCAYSIDGIECRFSGTVSSSTVVTLPPYRYLRTMVHPIIGTCWYWSRYPPGLDGLDPANDSLIIYTRFDYPECPRGSSAIVATTRAWEVFRSFPLAAPLPRIRPTVGITNLPSLVTATRPSSLRHTEVLPDGRLLEVEAYVTATPITWGDGATVTHPASATFGAGSAHAYPLKTCPSGYRAVHPLGRNCHPTLDSYRITVSFSWLGRYRAGGSWVTLGTRTRSVSFDYDVDEVVGVPVRP